MPILTTESFFDYSISSFVSESRIFADYTDYADLSGLQSPPTGEVGSVFNSDKLGVGAAPKTHSEKDR